jgi:8-oxo-dGTP pyrophosphatase MutT (NUDIX family)
MQVIYAQEVLPEKTMATIFLAGPSPRNSETISWRDEFLTLLEKAGYDGHVFVPLPRDGNFPSNYLKQATWEQQAQDRADVIVFWVSRDLESLPGFTTNVEFGQRVAGRNIVLGFPEGAPKTRFLSFLAERNFVDCFNVMISVVEAALRKIGQGAERCGGECEVPLHIWRLASFQSWLQTQKAAGNRLDGAKVELTFGVGPRREHVLYWAIHANIYVASENRNKSNEIVIGRPDIKHVVAYRRNGNDFLDTEVILIKEFRSTANTADGFIREVPGGSSFKAETAKVTAAGEFHDETGIRIDEDRLVEFLPRQLAGTTTVHRAHCFSLVLTEEEIRFAKEQVGKINGNAAETERTYVEVYKLRDLIERTITDWSNLGMIFSVVTQSNK